MFKSLQFRGNSRLEDAATNVDALNKGEFGHAVRVVQQAFIDLGYPMPNTVAKYGSPDDVYGQETKSVAYKFQVDQKLKYKDGVVGEQTMDRLDELLFEKKIPSKTLPTLPSDAPGASDDPIGNSLLVIRDTLTLGNPLTSMASFSLSFQQQNDASPTVVRISGLDYMRVADLFMSGKIALEIDTEIAEAAFYIPHEPPPSQIKGMKLSTLPQKNTLVLSRSLTYSAADRLLVIHEATHAICDMQGKGEMNALFSEIIGVVAEALYSRKRWGAAKAGGVKAYQIADEIAQCITNGKPVPTDKMGDLALHIRSVRSYGDLVYGTVTYSGI